ncbi:MULTISPECIES: hypothetical protein [unclassified Burkholderia]|uniref:hypothetical protein n=1 Tax=unclassified Burkholderia TaxID=2613784 RepID=UPI001F04593A|nr:MULTISPECIES: hypothetical protein [unclassified Burkholderia]
MKKFGKIALNIGATLVGGWLLANLAASLPIEMPDLLNDGLLFLLNAAGHDELANPDDMEVLAMLAILIISIAVAGIVVWLIGRGCVIAIALGATTVTCTPPHYQTNDYPSSHTEAFTAQAANDPPCSASTGALSPNGHG